MSADPIRAARAALAEETAAAGSPRRQRTPIRCETEDCPGQFHWATTVPGGQPMPVDAGSAGDPEGNLAVWERNGKLYCRMLGEGAEPGPREFRGVNHWATCTRASEHKSPAGWSRSKRHHRWEYRATAGGPPQAWYHVARIEELDWPDLQALIAGRGLPPLPAEARPQDRLL